MSAAQDKKKRQTARDAGTDKRMLAEREADEKRRKEKVKWTVWGVVIAVLVAAIILANSPLVYNKLNSVKIGGEGYNNAEYQYYYHSAYYNSYLSMFIDSNKPLTSQAFDPTYVSMLGLEVPESMMGDNAREDATWADYFRAVALDNMTQVTALYEAAVAAGYTLSEENSAKIDEEFVSLQSYADSGNYPNLKSYITAAYGRGCNEKILRGIMEMNYVADAYAQDMYDSYAYTADDLTTWYDENKDTYDTFDFDYYFVGAETESVTETVTDPDTGEETEQASDQVTEATMAAAKVKAEALAEAAREGKEAFAAAVAELGDDAELSEVSGVDSSYFDASYSEWMLESSRRAGDVNVSESENSGYYVVQYGTRDDNGYNTVSVRHILIKAEDSDGDGSISESELAAAKTAIDEIYAEWQAGEATEESFAALADEKSQDGGSNTNGGLYENIYKGQMVAEFNDFCFAPDRQTGDTEIVLGESNSYSGYHLIYFVGEDEPYRDYLADSKLRAADYEEWLDGLLSGYSASTNFVFKFAQK